MSRSIFPWIAATLVALLLIDNTALAGDAVFQYAVPVKAKKRMSEAFLWIPPRGPRLRGVVMVGMTLAERELAKDPVVRTACANQQLALVFLKTGLGSVDIQQVLDDLANKSGYRELSAAPLFFFGHSASGPQAKAAAIKFADRCFGVVQYRGGAPGGDTSVPPGIPALMMLGQFDEFGKGMMRDKAGRENWENGRDSLAQFRAGNPDNLGSIVIEPGAGHFAWSERNARYLALFLTKAAQAFIPDWSADTASPVTCKKLDAKTGWLSDLSINKSKANPPAAYGDYNAERARAGWHFDREMAEATLAYHKGIVGKKDQFLRWRDRHWVDAGARFYFNEVKWIGDGQTFEVHPVYAEVYPSVQKDGRGPRWACAGEKVGHGEAPIRVRLVGGPLEAVGPQRFRMKYDALAPATDPGRATFLAFNQGDGEYRYTEQVGMMPRGFSGLNAGKQQMITFTLPDELKARAEPLELAAKSDVALPVEYYVAYGPAVIEQGKLRIAELPARAKSPIEIKVVAYQFGRGVEPRVQTATPVERTLRLVKP